MFDYSINLFIVLIKYYIYSCRFSGQKPCVSGVINILKHTWNWNSVCLFLSDPCNLRKNCEEMGRY